MAINEKKMQIVIDNYFKSECNVNTSIRDAFEKGFRIGAKKTVHRPKGEWIENFDGNEWTWYCTNCKTEYYQEDLFMGGSEFPRFCPNCGADMQPKGFVADEWNRDTFGENDGK